MTSTHHHCDCLHLTLRYCQTCRVVYCENCKTEWAHAPCTRPHYTWWSQYNPYGESISLTGASGGVVPTTTTICAHVK